MDVMKHLINDRYVNPKLYSISIDNETATFLLYNLSGQIVGYQQYRPFAPKSLNNDAKDGRYYTRLTIENSNPKSMKFGVFGIETFHFRNDILFLVEGIFDAVRIHNLNLPCVATLTNNPKQLYNLFYIIGQSRKIISICDNDIAGKKLSLLSDYYKVCYKGKDLGDMTNQEVYNFMEIFL